MSTLIALAAAALLLGGEAPNQIDRLTLEEPAALRLVARDRTGRAALLDRFAIKVVDEHNPAVRETLVVYVGGARSPTADRVLKLHRIDCERQVTYELARLSSQAGAPDERKDHSPPIQIERTGLDELGEAVFSYVCAIEF